MEDDAPVIYGLEFQARALTPQTAETDAIRFLVGTQSLKYDNQIHIIDFDDENNIINKNVLLHQAGEIWHISASPADRGVLTTCYNRTSDSKVLTCAAVWRMPKELESGSHESPDDSSSTAQTLELLCHLDNTAHGNMACVVWEPMGDGKKIISLADNHILLWDLQESSSQAVREESEHSEGACTDPVCAIIPRLEALWGRGTLESGNRDGPRHLHLPRASLTEGGPATSLTQGRRTRHGPHSQKDPPRASRMEEGPAECFLGELGLSYDCKKSAICQAYQNAMAKFIQQTLSELTLERVIRTFPNKWSFLTIFK
ncbi:EARP complex and GARP complex interacting protein 1 [Homo sapiens]|uniref:EARP complex and GARP complex interacting protein 1 n=1 Tax=Homo sapiens TaxID=9606 RepID=D3YTH5_HUMAN|nr:EARP complex and GARP complex interacting protein 1 [Homo sapiens]KAI4033445.1 EARP complex and GARP complex interacting protein 1 [Homo sapiens]